MKNWWLPFQSRLHHSVITPINGWTQKLSWPSWSRFAISAF
ncbi:hypothetical protein ACFOG5_17065 [Pedobacter fastidiosus]